MGQRSTSVGRCPQMVLVKLGSGWTSLGRFSPDSPKIWRFTVARGRPAVSADGRCLLHMCEVSTRNPGWAFARGGAHGHLADIVRCLSRLGLGGVRPSGMGGGVASLLWRSVDRAECGLNLAHVVPGRGRTVGRVRADVGRGFGQQQGSESVLIGPTLSRTRASSAKTGPESTEFRQSSVSIGQTSTTHLGQLRMSSTTLLAKLARFQPRFVRDFDHMGAGSAKLCQAQVGIDQLWAGLRRIRDEFESGPNRLFWARFRPT